MSKKIGTLQFFLLFSLYTSQYMGLAYFTEAFIAILRQTGVSLENLGLIYMIGLFWVVRFLWAPFIDYISFKKLGHYRAWIIILQTLMAITLALTSYYDILTSLSILIVFIIIYSFLSATQEIAIDALIFKVVSYQNRPKANAIKSAGGMAGMVLGGGVGLILYEYLAWSLTMLLLALATSIGLVLTFLYKEPETNTQNKEGKLDYKQFISFWSTKRRKQWLFFLIIYPVTISTAFGLVTPMLVDLKWSLDKIGFYVHILGYGIGVISAFIASWFIEKYGKRSVLIVAAAGQIVGLCLLLLLAFAYDNTFIAMFVVGFIFSFYNPSAVVMNTLMMDEACEKTPASQFAIQHSIHLFSGIFFSGMGISLSGVFGYKTIIICGALIGLIALYASFKIRLLKE